MPSNDELLRAAIGAFQAGQLDLAERQFRALLTQEPRHLAGLNLLGMVLTGAGKFEDAERTIKAAIAVNANSDATHHNLGMVLQALARPEEAVASFDRAIAINPNAADSWNQRGKALNTLRRLDDALQSFNRAAGLKPDLVEAWLGLGSILSLAKDSEKALVAYDKALALNPKLPEAWLGRALSLAQLKRKEEAIAAYRDAARHGVDEGQVALHLAALGAAPPPPATPAASVIAAFDQYAETFDRNLIEDLKYAVPQAIADALRRHGATGGLDILDLGCGTGLTGERIAALKRTMTGVDLSPKMLEKARQRGIYDHLVGGELVAFLDSQQATCDVVVAADVFIYIGDLAPVFEGVRRALRKNGLFCFSLEASADADVVYRETFHYAHSAAYIRRLAQANGFAVEELEPIVIRQDGASPVDGTLAVLRCAEALASSAAAH